MLPPEVCLPDDMNNSSSNDMNPRSVTILSTSLTRAGAETQVARLAIELRARGWAVSVISMLTPDAFEAELAAAGVPVFSLDMTRGVPDPRALIACVSLLRRSRPRVLVTYMLHANLLGRIAAVLAGVPTVVSSVRSQWFGGVVWDLAMRVSDRLSSKTVTNSALVADQLVRRRVVSRGRSKVILNGLRADDYVHCEGIRQTLRAQLGVANGDFLWFSAGRLEAQKDHQGLLRAFRTVVESSPASRLFLAGQGPLLEVLQGQSNALGISDRVHFLGLREDIPALLSAADALVLSSAWEGLPNIVMEALAAGVPVVATAVGGVPELVVDGETGLLVPPGDPRALSVRMLELLALSDGQRDRLGLTGQNLVRERMDLPRIVDQWEELIAECLANSV